MSEMEGGAKDGEKSKGKENVEKQKTEDLKSSKKDKGNLREKVNFIARNREAAAAGRGGKGKMERKGGGGPPEVPRQGGGKPPGESEVPRQVIPRQPKAPKEAIKPQKTGGEATKVTDNCRPSKLTSTSEATNRVASRSTSLRLQASNSERPHSSQAKSSSQQTSLQKARPQSSRQQANRPRLQISKGKPSRKEEIEDDLVTGMINRNLHHLLSQIFLHQVQFTHFTFVNWKSESYSNPFSLCPLNVNIILNMYFFKC